LLLLSIHVTVGHQWTVGCVHTEPWRPASVPVRSGVILLNEIYGDVNSVKNTTINIWLNDGVY